MGNSRLEKIVHSANGHAQRAQPVALVDTQTFLKMLRQQIGITLIYYPGAWVDDTLETAFDRKEVIYLDSDNEKNLLKFSPGRNYVMGDYTQPPFKDEIFDAILYKDNDATEKEALQILRTLKQGGIVILMDDNACGLNLRPKEFQLLSSFKKVKLPFRHEEPNYITVFQKGVIL